MTDRALSVRKEKKLERKEFMPVMCASREGHYEPKCPEG